MCRDKERKTPTAVCCLQACSSWAMLTTWGTLWREEGWVSRSMMFASGEVCLRTCRIFMTMRPCSRWTQALQPFQRFFLSRLKNDHIKAVIIINVDNQQRWGLCKCPSEGLLIIEAIFGACIACPCPIIPCAVGVQYYTLLFFLPSPH